ncbi:carbohydrate binding domain-containing protein, partial [Aeromicrobium sp. Leaf272]
MGERTVTGMSAARRGCVVLISGIVTVGVLGTPAVGGQTSEAPTSATVWTPTTADVVRNHDFRQGRAYWYPNAGARLSVGSSGSARSLAVTNTSRRTKSINVRSGVSPTTFAAGTRVTVSAQVRASSSAGRIALRAQEHAAVASAPRWRTSPLVKSSVRYRTLTTTLTIGRDDSRITVRAFNLKAKGRQHLFVRSLKVTVVEPPAKPGEWIPNPGCTSGATGWTPSVNASVTALSGAEPACQVQTRSSGDDVTATSRTSTESVRSAGSLVHVASQVDVAGSVRPVRMTLQEVAPDGSILQSFAGVRDSAGAWVWLGAQLRTERAGSRIRVVYRGDGLAAGEALRFRRATVTVTDPATTPT